MYKEIALILFLFNSLFSTPTKSPDPPAGTLLLFTDSTQPLLTKEEHKALRQLAADQNVHFLQHDASKGLPAEVTTLPAIFFQNHLGRSAFFGRYNDLDRVRNFIRTSQMAHPQNKPNPKKKVLLWKNGKADVIIPVKVTALAGTRLAGFDSTAFLQTVVDNLAQGMSRFEVATDYDETIQTRSFYLNVYPWGSPEGVLMLTTEIFSRFHCTKPVFSRTSQPLVKTKWRNLERSLRSAGHFLEREILIQIKSSTIGDAFRVVPADAKTIDWAALGITHDIQQDNYMPSDTAKVELPQKWKVASRTNHARPLMIFHFLAPVDQYAGEVTALSGNLLLDKEGSMRAAKGHFVVNIADISMGADDFDREVQFKMLKRKLFPSASFTFSAATVSEPLKTGTTTHLTLTGDFTLMDLTQQVEVEAHMRPFVDKKGDPKIGVNVSFQLPLFDQFGIDGPEGPSPAKDVLQFYMQFNLEPDYS